MAFRGYGFVEIQNKIAFNASADAWMLLDVALPYVSLIAILLLNADRIFFTYETTRYTVIMSRQLPRIIVILLPWCISAVVVCTLWLGFSEVEPQPGVCMYGITKEANTVSTWLTVFIPAILIIILLVFVFIAAIGEIPAQNLPPSQNTHNTRGARTTYQGLTTAVGLENASDRMISWDGGSSLTRYHRRFIAALLAVDFISLALTLPFPAFSHVSPSCTDPQSCQSLRSLFQTLSWMRSSVVCIRPLFFTVLTDIRRSCVREDSRLVNHQNTTSLTEETREKRERGSLYKAETLQLTECHTPV